MLAVATALTSLPDVLNGAGAPVFRMWNDPSDILVASWFAALLPPLDESTQDSAVATWIEAARGGDREAARNLYRQFVPVVFRVARSICRSDAEAEDVVQDTFVQGLSNLSRYRPMPGVRFQSWLLAIARNAARKRMRWHRRAVLLDQDIDVSSGDVGADVRLEHARNRQALLRALGELPDREREIIALRYASELRWAEVAVIVGLSEANVRKICERVRDKLIVRVQELLASSTGEMNDE